MRYFLLSLFLGLATTSVAATTPADTAHTAHTTSSHQTRQHQAVERSRTGLEIYQGPISRPLNWLGDSSAVTPDTDPNPTSDPKNIARLLSPRAQSRAIARERVRQGWGKPYRE